MNICLVVTGALGFVVGAIITHIVLLTLWEELKKDGP